MEVNSPFRAIISFKPSSEADSQNWLPVAGVGGWSLVNAHNTTRPAHLLQAISYSSENAATVSIGFFLLDVQCAH